MAHNQKLRDQTREHAQYLAALNRKLDQMVAHLAQHGETLAAIVAHLGDDVVTAKMEDLRAKRRMKHEEELEASVKFMLDNDLAKLAGEDAVLTPESFVVLDEIAPDGTKTRAQHEMMRLDQAGQSRYLGKKVGDEVTNPAAPNYKVIVRAIYTIDMVKVKEFAARKKAEAQAHAAAAAAAVPTVPPTTTAAGQAVPE